MENKPMNLDDLITTAPKKDETKVEIDSNLAEMEAMIEKKENKTGLIIDDKELNKVKVNGEEITKESVFADVDKYLGEMDDTIEKIKALNLSDEEKPKNPTEVAMLIESLGDKSLDEIKKNNSEVKETIEASISSAEEVVENNSISKKKEEENQAKAEIVKVLIDKTGLGGEFHFTDDEKEKISKATEIIVTEVDNLELDNIVVLAPEKSFVDTIEELETSATSTLITLPASGFQAKMKGLSYGELGEISLNPENMTFDQIHRKLSVIYNNMINPTIGKFENFEDFLKKLSYVDIDLGVFGLVVSTFPEVDEIQLNCNNEKCRRTFQHKYSPRTLIRFDKMHPDYLSKMEKIVNTERKFHKTLMEESSTHKHKRVKLPESGYIIELGLASAYEYLYTIVDNLIGEDFSKKYPEDVNGILQLNSALLGMIRAVLVPNKNGQYVKYDKFDDMIHALYFIKPHEIQILSSLLKKYSDLYALHFQLSDITCPHCGTKTESINIDVSQLVFINHQRLMSTELNLENITIL